MDVFRQTALLLLCFQLTDLAPLEPNVKKSDDAVRVQSRFFDFFKPAPPPPPFIPGPYPPIYPCGPVPYYDDPQAHASDDKAAQDRDYGAYGYGYPMGPFPPCPPLPFYDDPRVKMDGSTHLDEVSNSSTANADQA